MATPHPNLAAEAQTLCALAEIPEDGAKGFTISPSRDALDLFVVRKGYDVYGYVNTCPHTGTSLDWVPNQFLDETGNLLQCATHGALFRIEDGFCMAGPCAGASLTQVKVRITDGMVELLGRIEMHLN
jgi:nitrite reductase/ring-hydroxylating ferredoxin subunit